MFAGECGAQSFRKRTVIIAEVYCLPHSKHCFDVPPLIGTPKNSYIAQLLVNVIENRREISKCFTGFNIIAIYHLSMFSYYFPHTSWCRTDEIERYRE